MALGALALSCSVRPEIRVPSFANGGLLRDAAPLPQPSYDALGAAWRVGGTGVTLLGPDFVTKAAVKRLSLFGRPDAIYAITEGGCLDGGARAVFEGHWRYAENVDVGLLRLEVADPAIARRLCDGTFVAADAPRVRLEGLWGKGDEEPNAPLSATFQAPLRVALDEQGQPDFLAGGHRASATIQDYGVSENSLPGMRMIELLGAEFAEVDTRLTKDGQVVLMHDAELSPRLVQGRFCKGYVADFTLGQLRASCRLENGEEIPTLAEALDVAFRSTRLRGVWLDTKAPEVLAPQLPLAADYTARGARRLSEGGLPFTVVNGMYDASLVEVWKALPHPPGAVCLVESDAAAARDAGCLIWAPRFTLGPQAEEVAAAQASGLRVVYWTVNGSDVIDKFLKLGKPNAMISDTPGLVFYKYNIGDFTPPRPGRR